MFYTSGKDFEWEAIVRTIKLEKCVVFVGPDLYTDNAGELVLKQLPQVLNAKFHPEETPDTDVVYYPEEELFYFRDTKVKSNVLMNKAAPFFEEIEGRINRRPFELLADIPFPLYISLTPDHVLRNVFLEKKREHDFAYFKSKEISRKVAAPSKIKPLIYNILGSWTDEDSLVLTNETLLEYMFSLFKDKSLPDELLLFLREAKTFLFLGLKFDKWYMRPLLKLLEINKAQKEIFNQYVSVYTLDKRNVIFCEANFKLEFLATKPADFVEKLYAKSDEILRSQSKEVSKIDVIQKLIREDDLEKAVKLLIEAFEEKKESELADEVRASESRINRINRQLASQSILREEATVSRNRIADGLKIYLDDLKNILAK